MTMSVSKEQRKIGCLIGLAAGDAVGTTLEFKPPGSFAPISDMVGGGPFGLEVGQWTDDTSMALCLGESLATKQCFDPIDQMNRYCNWWQYGYMSSTGECFDIGNTVRAALGQYLTTQKPFSGAIDDYSSGNGALMRLAPVPMFYADNIDDVIYYSGESSRTTHGSAKCIDACRLFGAMLCTAFNGASKDELLRASDYYAATEPSMADIANGSYINKQQVKGSGYVVASLEAALWCFYHTNSFKDAVLKAANLGDDADTTAAICGQIAGAYYGIDGIPAQWVDQLSFVEDITSLAERLANG